MIPVPAPLENPKPSPLRPSALVTVIGALALGVALGDWVLGPALSHDTAERPSLPSAKLERAMIDAMSARPNPSPYRTATPDFDMPNVPHYAALAKEKAENALGRRTARHQQRRDDGREAFGYAPGETQQAWQSEPDRPAYGSYPQQRSPQFDRHRVY